MISAPPAGSDASRSFTPILVATMASATFSLVVFGVLASELIDVFGISRSQVGYLVTATGLVGAASSPLIGPLADRFGARAATLATLAISAISLVAVAVAPRYLFLIVAAALTGLAQAGGNPSTNKLIAERVAIGRRGVVTGLKQSGVQFGVFLGGLGLPMLSAALGWRAAVLIFAAVPVVVLLVALVSLGPDPVVESPAEVPPQWRPSPMIIRLAVYGMCLGAATSAITTYLALFGEEVLGASAQVAGRAVALLGVVGIAARIGWGRVAEHRLSPGRALEIIALIAAATAVVLALGSQIGLWALWLAAIGAGMSAVAWNAVGMLAVILFVPADEAGRASGVVLAGFLLGIAFGAPSLGLVVDALGDYRLAWIGVVGVSLVALVAVRGAFAGTDTEVLGG